ncbi:arsenate reductase [Babesia caballi]|uniref:Arsenate reductase n=1 Tax=Babesia caballi TaxID=5871 RepID=A0AAV4LPU7_BABCB|nr:arsenate reductase [Babesia caballi]
MDRDPVATRESSPVGTLKRRGWIGGLGARVSLFVLICSVLFLPCVLGHGGANSDYRDEGENDPVHIAQKGSQVVAADIGEGASEVVSDLANGIRTPGDIGDSVNQGEAFAGDALDEDLSDAFQNLDQRTNEASASEVVAQLIRERDDLRQTNEDLSSLIELNLQNAARLEQEIEQLKEVNRQLKGVVVQNSPNAQGATEVRLDDFNGILNAITLAELPRVVYVAYRAPFVLLRHHSHLYARVDEAVGQLFNRYIVENVRKGPRYYKEVLVSKIRNVFNRAFTHLTTQLSAQATLHGEYLAMNRNLEVYMKVEHKVNAQLVLPNEGQYWSFENIGAVLYNTLGLKHCLYWWYALMGTNKVIQGSYTVPQFLLTVYGYKLRLLSKHVEIFLLWVTASTTFVFLDQETDVEGMQKIEHTIRKLYDFLVVSPFTIRKGWLYVVEVACHLFYRIDHNLEMFYAHLMTVYKEFEFLYPRTPLERLGVAVTIVCSIIAVVWLTTCALSGIIRVICCLVRRIKELRFIHGGCGRLRHWYKTSFLRWSFDLLQTERDAAKPMLQGKTRKRVKNVHAQGSGDEPAASSAKKGNESSNKSNALWNGVSRRNRLRDPVAADAGKSK